MITLFGKKKNHTCRPHNFKLHPCSAGQSRTLPILLQISGKKIPRKLFMKGELWKRIWPPDKIVYIVFMFSCFFT